MYPIHSRVKLKTLIYKNYPHYSQIPFSVWACTVIVNDKSLVLLDPTRNEESEVGWPIARWIFGGRIEITVMIVSSVPGIAGNDRRHV